MSIATITIPMAISIEITNLERRSQTYANHYNFDRYYLVLQNQKLFNILSLSQTIMTTQSTNETNTCPNSPTSIITNHCEYYLPGGDLFIKVDNTLFCMHTYFFIHESIIWQNVLGTTHRGQTATDPLILGTHILCSTTPIPDSFTNFLWVFYNPIYSKYITTKETWTEIYTYALNWRFNKIQGLCW